jgi:subtilisin family serine protease
MASLRLLAIVLLLSALPAHAQPPAAVELIQGRAAAAGEVLVKFRGTATADTHRQVRRQEDADVLEPVGGAGALRLRSRSKGVGALMQSLGGRPDVEYVEPNYIVHTQETLSNDASLGSLWGLRNTGQVIGGVAGTPGADVKATKAWDVTTGSSGIVVGVVDTGVDYNHPDLAANMWTAPHAFTVTIAGQTITCDTGTRGFNAINNTCNPADDNNHGTHVSGTIGATGNNAAGVVGVNWTTRIMGLKFLGASGSGSTANAINAIEFAVQAKLAFGAGANVRVLSNSWGGGGFSQSLLNQINRANTHGMLFVAAAGNSGSNNDITPSYPASYNAPNVVAVAATDNRDGLASFSSYGASSVDLGAPGVYVLSTIRNSGYAYFNGTSMATPHVSGAAALVLSVCALDTAGLRSNLLASVDPIASLAGKTVTGGRLNADTAVRACATTPPPPSADFTVSATPASSTVTSGVSTTYTVSVQATSGSPGAIGLSVSGLPANATWTFSPTSVTDSGTSILTVTTAGVAAGTSTLTITGTGAGLTRTATVQLVVQAPSSTGDFAVSATPSSRAIKAGSSTTYSVTVTPSGGFTGTVSLSATGLPSGATASFSPSSVAGGSGSSTLTVSTKGNTAANTYTVTIRGTSGGLTRQTTVSLKVCRPNVVCN